MVNVSQDNGTKIKADLGLALPRPGSHPFRESIGLWSRASQASEGRDVWIGPCHLGGMSSTHKGLVKASAHKTGVSINLTQEE